MSKTYEYETKVGMLKYKVDVSETTIDDDGISLLVTYESYETGIAYETTYDHEDIGKIHKLFVLDPTIILDMVSDNKLITKIDVDSKDVLIFYNMVFMKRAYEIVLKADRVTHEGVDSATGDLQRQNKILLRQVSKLTDRLDYMEKQIESVTEYCVKLTNEVDKIRNMESELDKLVITTDQHRNLRFVNSNWHTNPYEYFKMKNGVDFKNATVIKKICEFNPYRNSSMKAYLESNGLDQKNIFNVVFDIIHSARDCLNDTVVVNYDGKNEKSYLLAFTIDIYYSTYIDDSMFSRILKILAKCKYDIGKIYNHWTNRGKGSSEPCTFPDIVNISIGYHQRRKDCHTALGKTFITRLNMIKSILL